MKLHLTATSERGKPVTKSGNENIEVELTVNRKLIGCIYLDYKDDRKDGDEMDEWVLSWHNKLHDDIDPEIISQGNI